MVRTTLKLTLKTSEISKPLHTHTYIYIYIYESTKKYQTLFLINEKR